MTENKNCVSLFKNVRDMNVEMVSMERIFQLITSDLYRDSTEKYRYFVSSGLSKDAEAVKRQAAGFVPSAVCRGGRTEKHVMAYTGFAMADFDNMEPDDFQRCLSLLESDPYVLLAYVTISGKGLRIIYRTDLADKRFHSFAFTNGNEYFAKLINSAPDPKCKNLTRLSFLAYDPKAIFHPQAIPFHVEIDSDSKKPVGRPHLVHNADLSEALPIVLKQLEKQGKTYVAGHYNEYVSTAMYLLNRYGVSLTEASKWALTEFPDYESSQLQTIATSAYQRTDEFGSMKLPAPSIYSSIDEIEEYVLTQAKIRYNELLGRREICWTEATQYTDLTDSDENTLWIRSLKAGLNSTFRTFLCILDSDFTPIYNPLVEFLQNKEPWDGVTDYISQVSGMVHTTAPELFTLYFKKWIVASIAAILDSNVVNHTILTFLGEQGIYKTTFLNHLLPPELQRYFYTKVNSGYFTKDDQFTLAEFAFICLEEIDSMRPSEVNQIKAMVSAPNINERAAYARNKSFRPHVASFCATGNNRFFLTDDSGNRRWLPFYVNHIDDPFRTVLPYAGLYAQAVSLYRSGFRYWFTDAEVHELNNYNKDFEEPNIEEELICQYFRTPNKDEKGSFMSVAEIMERIGTTIKYNLSKSKINRAMDKLGYVRTHNDKLRGFLVIAFTPDELANRKQVTAINSPQKQPLLPF